MKKNTAVLLILNISFCCSSLLWPRLKRNSDADFDYSNMWTRFPRQTQVLQFSQPLDHLNPKFGHWNQRYAVNAEFYKKAGPSFLYVRAAGPMDYGSEIPYHVLAYAKHLNAIVFALEHRFYGRTRPANGSVVLHLSTAQALADIANFIKGMPKEFHLPKDTKWIVFGCSYGGKLAAWGRLKYPHLIHGAVASSAPLLSKVDYYEYDQIVEISLRSYDSECVPSIIIAFEMVKYTIDSPQNGMKLSQMFYLDDYDTFNNIVTIKSIILGTMLGIISDAVQYNDTTSISIPVVCRIMTEYKGTRALAELRKMDTERKDGRKMQSEKNQKVQNSEKDYDKYDQIVEMSLRSYDSQCVLRIVIAFEMVKYTIDSPQNRMKLSQMFYLDNYDTFNNIVTIKSIILGTMLGIISDAVQYNDTTSISIPVVCRIMSEYEGTEAFAELRKMDMERKDGRKMQSEKNQKVQNSEKDYDRARNEAWEYQRCSEFGYFSSFTNTNFLRGVKHFLVPIERDIKRSCTPFFGPNFSIQNLTEKINHINSQYGGLDFNIDHTIFINGSLDPWYRAGLYIKSNGSLYDTIFIKGTSHCADIHPATDSDIPELRNARNKVFKTLQGWLETKST